ncbi:MAG: thioredoxin domain-containing protein [bacterium]|nr:thioredoxin domain-containing protein [bacterium]
MKKTQKTKKKKIETTQVQYRGQWSGWLVIIMAAAGLGISLYLYSLHMALLMGEIKDGFLCGTESGLGCHSVTSSPYSVFLGLPLATWGAVFYSAIIFLALGGVIFRRDSGPAFLRWALLLAVLGLAFDMYLAHTMIFRIRAVCRLCIATYLINLSIIIILLIKVRRETGPRVTLNAIFPWTKDTRGIDLYYRNVIKGLLIGGFLLAAVAGIASSQFLSKSLTENDRQRLAKVKKNLLRHKPKSIAGENRPYMGSADAKVTVVEFSDFLCPYCAKTSKYLKLSESANHDRARFIFRHYPLDKSCNRRLSSNVHPGACLLAESAVCAAEQDRFWQYHDVAFKTKGKITRPVVQDIAADVGLDLEAFNSCLDSGRGLRVVKEDIEAGIKAGIRGTPALFVNGRGLRGVPKPWILNEILRFSEKNLAPPE